MGKWHVDKKRLPAALFSVAGLSLILAYNRGLFEKIDWLSAQTFFDLWVVVVLGVLVAIAYVGLIKLSNWIWPPRGH